METLEIFGKYGGVGGLAIGAVLFFMRHAISEGMVKLGLRPVQSYKLLMTMVFCMTLIGLAGISAWAYTSVVANNKPIISTEGDQSPIITNTGGNVTIGNTSQ